MILTLRQIGILAAKDLRIEARGRHTIALVIMLGVLIIVVLAFGLGTRDKVEGFEATSILWVAYLLCGLLFFEKTMAVDHADEALAGLLLAPIDRGVIYTAKLVTNLALIAVCVLAITPVAIVLFRFDLSEHAAGFVLVTALGMIGFAAIGTLFAAAASSTQPQAGFLAMLVFPLSLPLVIVSGQLMRHLFEADGYLGAPGVLALVAFDMIFLTLSGLVFELIIEP